MQYKDYSKEQLFEELGTLKNSFEEIKAMGLKLNMARGVPSPDQLKLSLPMLDILYREADCTAEDGTDCRNYGVMDGIPECKRLMADLMGVTPDMVMHYLLLHEQAGRAGYSPLGSCARA